MDILNEIKDRRSCRAFKVEMPTDEEINKVVEAGLYAATGHGTQNGKIVVITNKKIRDALASLNAEILERNTDTFYGAPVILLVMVKKFHTDVCDGSCMIENMMLEASSIGLGSCWIHRAKEELESPKGREILKDLPIDFDEYVGVGHVALGYKAAEPKEKKILEDRVLYLR